MRSAVVVPLAVRGRSLRALTLVHAESERRFDQVDLAFAERLGAAAAVALDNARLYEQQRRTAQTLQTALLPTALPRCRVCG
jgi:GAF domain-containing protein